MEKPGFYIKDVIHGHIYLTTLEKSIIDTIEFQALRDVKQLGHVYSIYPGATHSRFEHSIGVAFMAGKVMDFLEDTQHKLGGLPLFTPRQRELIKIGGLTHDLGHLCDSHLFDEIAGELELDEKMRDHEDRSCILVDHIVTKYKIPITKEEVEFITQVIKGDAKDSEKSYMFEIVANHWLEIDIDKEYLLRDAYYCGFKREIDFSRLYQSARVMKTPDNKYHIIFHEKTAPIIVDLFELRAKMFKEVYCHKTVMKIKTMLCEMHNHMDQAFNYAAIFEKPDQAWRLFFTDHLYHCLEVIPMLNNSPFFFKHEEQQLHKARELYRKILRREFSECKFNIEDILKGKQKFIQKALQSILLYRKNTDKLIGFIDVSEPLMTLPKGSDIVTAKESVGKPVIDNMV
jgi:deoxynucleoside triphosphate triphosphohydrolase SAMHD1